jgi:hypothetical protein
MPYRNAPYYVAFVIAVIAVGFWPSYWSVLGGSLWQFHLHGAVSSVWVLMVLFQSWAVRKNQLAMHRATGRASLFLFPLLIGGLCGIIDVTAKNYALGDATQNPVTMAYGPSFLAGLVPAVAAYLTLYYLALKNRRSVWPHAGYLLGTPIILFESPFSRVLGNLGAPGFAIRGPDDFDRILPSILFSDALALVFCLVVYWRIGPKARPFLVTGAFVALQMVMMGTMNQVAAVKTALVALGGVPSTIMVAAGIALGAAASWFGWQAGKRPAVPAGGSPQAA